MPFDGIGLDFPEGKETLQLIESYGFPKEKKLFAGLVNGKISGKIIMKKL